MKKYNFNAGPSILPREVIEATAKQILDVNGSGLSLMEIRHRAKDFQPVVDEAVALVKELLNIPEGYSVIFLGGGASLEFCMVPYNFLKQKAAYLETGVWAEKAIKEGKFVQEIVQVLIPQKKGDPMGRPSSLFARIDGRSVVALGLEGFAEDVAKRSARVQRTILFDSLLFFGKLECLDREVRLLRTVETGDHGVELLADLEAVGALFVTVTA